MINIWFPGRVYLAGDFNSSGKDDFAFIETRGKRPGWSGWMSSNGDGEYSAVRPLVVSSEKILSKLDVSVAISDDFNRDGFDDIILVADNRGNKYSMRLLINLSGSGFSKPVPFESPFTQIGEDITLIQSGDFNGDRFADLAIPFVDNDDMIKWHVAYNLQGKGFSEPSLYSTPLRVLPGCDRYTHLLGDFNGDGLSDTGVYWQSGERAATWSLTINTGNGMGGPEFMARFPRGIMAFQGEYFPMVSDFNGDGFDDLMVKMGSRDNYSEWYIMKNQGHSTFINKGFTAKEW